MKTNNLLFLATFFAVIGCNRAVPEICPAVSDLAGQAATKVISLGDEYLQTSFLLKTETVIDEEVLLKALAPAGVESVQKLFTSAAGKEDLERKFGLDRWYEVILKEGSDFQGAVNATAALDAVAVVEYNAVAQKASDCKVYPYDGPTVSTKAGEDTSMPFNDPALTDQWHYCNTGNVSISKNVRKGADINVFDVWRELTCGDPSIIVAVVDEGVKHSHPDLNANMWINAKEIPGNGIDDDGNGYIDDIYGYNFVDNGPISWAKTGDTGHGTHCAGTIAAVNNNGTGVSGVAGGSGNGNGCRIMSCQIFSGKTGGAASQTANAIKYAADMGASVISCSFGYTTAFSSDNAYLKSQGSAEIDAIHYFEASRNNNVLDGNIAVFAAGNESHNYAHYPGAFHDIISVTAFGPDYLPTYYTNYGPGCNIVAPGGESYHSSSSFKSMVLSTVPSELAETGWGTGMSNATTGHDYGYMQGTSMACPHVSGIVALALSYAKKTGKHFSRDKFKEMIITSANDLDSRLSSQTSKSYAYGHADLPLAPFYHQLGTGSIDTWQLMMQIEGIQSLMAVSGKNQWLDLSPYFGTASTSLTYLGVDVSEETSAALGLAEEPYIKYGRLYIHPTQCGSGKIRVRAVGGGSTLGGGDNAPGGMEVSQDISIIVRSVKSENGGWL